MQQGFGVLPAADLPNTTLFGNRELVPKSKTWRLGFGMTRSDLLVIPGDLGCILRSKKPRPSIFFSIALLLNTEMMSY